METGVHPILVLHIYVRNAIIFRVGESRELPRK